MYLIRESHSFSGDSLRFVAVIASAIKVRNGTLVKVLLKMPTWLLGLWYSILTSYAFVHLPVLIEKLLEVLFADFEAGLRLLVISSLAK